MNSRMTIRSRFKFIMFLSFAVTIGLATLFMGVQMWHIGSGISQEYASFYTENLASTIETYLTREIALAEKEANTPAIIEWLKDENDPIKKELALEAMGRFNLVLQSDNSFAVSDKTQNFYFVEGQVSDENFKSQGRLDANILEDSWYFETLETGKPYTVFVDQDRFLNHLRLWVNVKVMSEGQIVGVLGTGMYIKPILQDIYEKHKNSGAVTLVVDDQGRIQLDERLNYVHEAPNSENLYEHDIYKYIEDPTTQISLMESLKKREPSGLIPIREKGLQYLFTTPIDYTNWHVITFFSPNSLFNPSSFAFMFFMLIVFISGFGLTVNIVVERLFIKPFTGLNESLERLTINQDMVLEGLERQDEFGLLARNIQEMTDRLVRSVPVGMFLLGEMGTFIFGNPYFYTLFDVKERAIFKETLAKRPEIVFVRQEEYEMMRSAIAKQESLYIFEVELVSLTGRRFWSEVRLSQSRSETGQVQYEGILINIQAKKDYEKQLRSMAETDQLTGLFNRYHLEKIIKEEIVSCDLLGTPLSMIIFDLDHFKLINDNYGHDMGDEVLKNTAMVANQVLRSTDTLVRWGGEEFAVLMPNTNLQSAEHVAQKLKKRFELLIHNEVGQVTASFGVAERRTLETYSDWFRRGDQALLSAKELGRNRVVVSEALPHHGFMQLVWQPHLESGNAQVDLDHQLLFSLSNELMDAAQTKDLNQCLEVFDHLLVHIEEHFKHESEVLEISKCPKDLLETHNNIHETLAIKMYGLKKDLMEEHISPVEVFFTIVNEVIVEHLMKEDSKFFSYLNEKHQ